MLAGMQMHVISHTCQLILEGKYIVGWYVGLYFQAFGCTFGAGPLLLVDAEAGNITFGCMSST